MKTIKEYRDALQNIAEKDCVVEFSDFTDYVPISVLRYEDVELLDNALDELEQYRNNPQLTLEQLKTMIDIPVWSIQFNQYVYVNIKYTNGKPYVRVTLLKWDIDGYGMQCYNLNYVEGEFFAKEVIE